MGTAQNKCCHHILFALNSSNIAGGAMTGILQLVKALPTERYRSYLVVPTQPTPEVRRVLEKAFYEITVVAMGGGWIKSSSRPLARLLLSELAINLRTIFHLRVLWKLHRLIRRWKIDLIYTGSALVWESALAAKLAGRPHIWHIKEQIGRGGITQFFWPDFVAMKIMMGLSSRIIVMSDFIGRAFARYNGTSKVTKIHDGLDFSDFNGKADGKSLRRRLGVRDDEFSIGLIASINASWKKHEIFIQAAALIKEMIPNARFIHYGHIPSSGHHQQRYQTLRQMIDDLGLTKDFIWAGVNDNIPEMMATLDVLLHPSDVEPFGRVAIEAMAAGVPVVGPAAGGIAESVVDQVTGLLVRPGDPQAFAIAVTRLLLDERLRRQMSEKGRSHVKNQFSIEQHVKKITALYHEILDESRLYQQV